MLWALPLAMGAAGLLKGQLIDKPRERRDRTLAAETQRYSPWTGLRANPVREADPFGSMLQGGMAGLQMGMDPGFENMFRSGPKPTGAAMGTAAGAYTSQGLSPSQGIQSFYSRLANR